MSEAVASVIGKKKQRGVRLIQASTKVRVMRGYGGESLGKFVTNVIRRPSEIVRQKWLLPSFCTMFLSCSVRQNWLFPKMTTLVRFCPISFVQQFCPTSFPTDPPKLGSGLVAQGSTCNNFSERTTHY